MYKIETGIPIPKARSKYPFKDMEVGDSFFIPKLDANLYKMSATVASSARMWAKKNGVEYKFKTQINEDGVRVFRIK